MSTTNYTYYGLWTTGYPSVNDVYTDGINSFRITAVDNSAVGTPITVFNATTLSGVVTGVTATCGANSLAVGDTSIYFMSLIKVTSGGSPLSSVTGIGAESTVGSSGVYWFTDSAPYTATHTPVLSGYTFDPTSVSFTNQSTPVVNTIEATGLPAKCTSPTPSDAATGQVTNLSQLSWTVGANTNTIAVYFNGSLVYSGASTTSYSLTTNLAYATAYSWRIDSTNDAGTTTGDTWTFTTVSLQAMPASYDTKRIVLVANNTFWYEDI